METPLEAHAIKPPTTSRIAKLMMEWSQYLLLLVAEKLKMLLHRAKNKIIPHNITQGIISLVAPY